MATPTAKRPPNQRPARKQVEVVDPRWLLKALGLTILAAVVLAYLAVCLLVYAGSWQLILHPSPTVDRNPSVPFQSIRFDSAATGTPRLTGWWIPAESGPAPTILFLHDGSGSLSSNVQTLDLLHQANVNLFAFDYRGFGKSGPPHPSEARMTEDTAAALDYLIATRHIPAATIIPYGVGVGAALAAGLAQSHPELPALIIDNPDPGAAARPIADSRSRFVPVGLLLHDRFDIGPLRSVITRPKLLITGGPADTAPERDKSNAALFASLAGPKFTIDIPRYVSDKDHRTLNQTCGPSPATPAQWYVDCPGPAYVASVRRFLDQYLSTGIDTLTPTAPAATKAP
jgi:pimeloyl-ACP methyl ester carboxylesterase